MQNMYNFRNAIEVFHVDMIYPSKQAKNNVEKTFALR